MRRRNPGKGLRGSATQLNREGIPRSQTQKCYIWLIPCIGSYCWALTVVGALSEYDTANPFVDSIWGKFVQRFLVGVCLYLDSPYHMKSDSNATFVVRCTHTMGYSMDHWLTVWSPGSRCHWKMAKILKKKKIKEELKTAVKLPMEHTVKKDSLGSKYSIFPAVTFHLKWCSMMRLGRGAEAQIQSEEENSYYTNFLQSFFPLFPPQFSYL